MDTAGYVALSRQAGLMKELQGIANNLANMSTTGFRREGTVFAEMIQALPDGGESLAMTDARGRYTDTGQGGLEQTNGTYDLAIEGAGFMAILTPSGERLTRAGAFSLNATGEIVTMEGYPLLDSGNSPVAVPPGALQVAIAPDGTLSADGVPVAQIGLFEVTDTTKLFREDGVRFRSESEILPAESAALVQGFLESSNTDPVAEMTRMIEVQRAYEAGQNFLDREDERIRAVVRTLGPRG